MGHMHPGVFVLFSPFVEAWRMADGGRALMGRLGSALAGRLLAMDLDGDPARDRIIGVVETDE